MFSLLGSIVIAFLFLWLFGLTFFLFRLRRQYQFFTQGSDAATVHDILTSITKNVDKTQKDLATLLSRFDRMQKDGELHIQKIGLLRFNPFKDTGGEQSFALALVDAHDTGVVVSALYSRSGTRWYAKKVVLGKGEEYELSEEEQKAVRLAKPVKNS